MSSLNCKKIGSLHCLKKLRHWLVCFCHNNTLCSQNILKLSNSVITDANEGGHNRCPIQLIQILQGILEAIKNIDWKIPSYTLIFLLTIFIPLNFSDIFLITVNFSYFFFTVILHFQKQKQKKENKVTTSTNKSIIFATNN